MQLLSRFPGGTAAFLQWSELRTTIQTVVAVLLSFFLMQLLPLQTVTWAVFSALFVVQASVGGTVGTALRRVTGAMVGAVLAVVLIVLIGTDHTVTTLSLGVLIMSVLSIRWPSLSYGLVTVSIIAVTPGIGVVEEAAEKLIAVAIGSLSAILASMIAFPISARRKAVTQLADALRLAADYIDTLMTGVIDGDGRDIDKQESKAIDSLRAASEVWERISLERPDRTYHKRHRPLLSKALLNQTNQLGNCLALTRQLSTMRPLYTLDEEQVKAMRDFSDSLYDQLTLLSDAMVHHEVNTDIPMAWEHYQRFCEVVDDLSPEVHSQEQREHLMALKWSCHAILTCLNALVDEVRGSTAGKAA